MKISEAEAEVEGGSAKRADVEALGVSRSISASVVEETDSVEGARKVGGFLAGLLVGILFRFIVCLGGLGDGGRG